MGVKMMMMMLVGMFAFGAVYAQTTDLERLQQFYEDCNGNQWLNNNNWMDTSISFCNWYGVHCDNNVTKKLLMKGNGLYGQDCITDHPVWNNWETVQILDLSHNYMGGSFASTLGTMSGLKTFNLAHCPDISGLPTEIGDLSSLTYLDLSYVTDVRRYYGGGFPTEIGNIQTLQFLDISHSTYDYYDFEKLPSYIENLRNLRVLNVSSSRFSGEIPSGWENLKALTTLNVRENALPLPLPSFLTTLPLEHLDIAKVGAVGPLDVYLENVYKLYNLQFLSLGYNGFTGTVPSAIQKMTSLTAFAFGNNNLHGELPTSAFENMPNLKTLWGGFNHFNGTLGDFVCQLDHFRFFGSEFHCPLPECCGESYNSENTHCGFVPCILPSA